MKLKRISVLLIVLAAVLLMCVSAQAAAKPETGTFEDFLFTEKEGFTTLITDLHGNRYTYGGVLQVSSLELHSAVAGMAAYDVCFGGDVVLSVQLHGILPNNEKSTSGGVAGKPASNGYYSIDLPLGDGYAAFLTGLTPEYLAEMQSAALDAILTDSELQLENVGFIDTEKQFWIYDNDQVTMIDSDVNMCWASSMANILHYTGWAKKAGFGSTDYLFEALIDGLPDETGSTDCGLQWFFNGYNPVQGLGASVEEGHGAFPGHLPDYCFQSVVQSFDLTASPNNMALVLEGLREGCGAELGISWMLNWSRTGGHSVSLWGMVYRSDADLTAKDTWHALIISDSDNSVTFGENRRTAPNTLTLCRITPVCEAGFDSWYFDRKHQERGNGTGSDGFVTSATLLKPYSDALEKDGGTRDTTADPDWAIVDITTADLNAINYTPYLAADSKFFLSFNVQNQSLSPCSADLQYQVRVTKREDEDFSEVFSGTVSADQLTDNYESVLVTVFDRLTPGSYDAEVTVTSGEAEAYLSNNTRTKPFFVCSRLSSEDDLSFEAEAFFDGPPIPGYYGNGGIGRLVLRYSGSIGYPTAQYSVSVRYSTGAMQTLYQGKDRPETVFGLKPLGSRATVSIYATPEDPSVGYERFLGRAEVDLTYYLIQVEAEDTVFSPITETDQWLPYGENITLSFRKKTSNQEDAQFYYRIFAENESSFIPVNEGLILSDGFSEGGYLEYPIHGFFLWDQDLSDWRGVTLPAGQYSLRAYVYYDIDPNGYYTYSDRILCGELTVLPTGRELKNITHSVLSANETLIQFTISAAPCDSLRIRLLFGTDPEQLDEYTLDYKPWSEGVRSDSFVMNTEAQTVYYYRLALYTDDNEPIVYDDPERFFFLTPESAGEEAPQEAPSPTFEPLSPGETAIGLSYGGEIYYETFVPEEDGVWSLSFAGPDGCFCVWDEEEAAWSEPEYFSLSGKRIEVEAEKGQPVRLYVYAYMAGDYLFRCEPSGTSYYLGADGIGLCLGVEAGELCIAAAYSSEGQLLSAQAAEEPGPHVFYFAGKEAARVRVFRLDDMSCMPISQRIEVKKDA